MIPLYENNRGYRQGRKQCTKYGTCSFQIGLFCPPGANCYNSSISCTNDAELFHQNHRFQDLVTFQKRKARAGISGRGGGFSRLLTCGLVPRKIYGFWVCAEVLPSFFEIFRGAAEPAREKSRKNEAKPRRTTQKSLVIFFGRAQNPNNMGGFTIRQGAAVFFLGGTPQKKTGASSKTSHIVWVL